MLEGALPYLLAVAAGLGVIHTITGPDHYVPFIAMSKVGKWSAKKTLLVTWLSGLGHVAGSLVIGLLGVAIGKLTLDELGLIEDRRGQLAGFAIVAFGLAYTVWGARRSLAHEHVHAHTDGTVHSHEHTHLGNHLHVHAASTHESLTPWILFAIFVFGPCEVLIPVLMLPAAELGGWAVASVVLVFTVSTLATMSAAVWLGLSGLRHISAPGIGRYAHVTAGLAIVACGLAVSAGL